MVKRRRVWYLGFTIDRETERERGSMRSVANEEHANIPGLREAAYNDPDGLVSGPG